MSTALERRLDHLEQLLGVADEEIEFLGHTMPRSRAEAIIRASMGRTIEPVPQTRRTDPPGHTLQAAGCL